MLDLWAPVNRRSSMMVVVGRYPTIPLEMSVGIVYVPTTDSQRTVSCGRHVLGRGRTQIIPTVSLRKVALHGLFSGARMLYWSGLDPYRVGY
jgi:hypothetical protein